MKLQKNTIDKINVVNFILILILTCSVGLSCVKDEPQDAKDKEKIESEQRSKLSVKKEKTVDRKITTFSLSGQTDNDRKWNIEGESADVIGSGSVSLKKVKAKTDLKDGFVTITSNSGRFDKIDNVLKLNKNVIAKTQDGIILKTEHLKWDAQNQVLWTDDFITVTKDKIKTSGYGASAHPNLSKIVLKDSVKIKIHPSTVIECEGPFIINYEEGLGYLNRNVRVEDENGKLTADKAKVFFDSDKEKITKIIAEGRVAIKRDNNSTFSQKVIYYIDKQKIVLKGKPRLLVYSTEDLNF